MTAKGKDFYLALDLDLVAAQLAKGRDARMNYTSPELDNYADLSRGLLDQCHIKQLAKEDVSRLLGAPDSLRSWEEFEIWYYDFTDWYGPTKICSSTPYVFDKSGRLIGVFNNGKIVP